MQLELFPNSSSNVDCSQSAGDKRRQLQDQWGGFWRARFKDGSMCFAPGTRVYLPKGKPLAIARVEAAVGALERSKLTCLYLKSDELVFLHELTDKMISRRKSEILMPCVLYGERECAVRSGKQTPQQRQKGMTGRVLRERIKKEINTEYQGRAHNLISFAANYRTDNLARAVINDLFGFVQMQLVANGTLFDSDDFMVEFFTLIDEVGAMYVGNYDFSWT